MDEKHQAPSPATYSIGGLAATTGVSRRTVRFYVSQSLIDSPQGRGRGSVYTQVHVEQIRRVRALQRQGLELETIRTLPGDTGDTGDTVEDLAKAPPATTRLVVRVQILAGVRLELDATRRVPAAPVLEKLAVACRSILENTFAAETEGDLQ